MCLVGLLLVIVISSQQKGRTQFLLMNVDQMRFKMTAADSSEVVASSLLTKFDPVQRPLRDEAENVVHQVENSAQLHSVSLRTLSVSHQSSSAHTWGRVLLDVSASGSYMALKAWQASMQRRFPALSVQSLRLQGNYLNQGDLDAQVLWVLHVRD